MALLDTTNCRNIRFLRWSVVLISKKITLIALCSCFILASCSASDGSPTDTAPTSTLVYDTNFTDQQGIDCSTAVESNRIIIEGIRAASSISVTGGEYAINGGSYTPNPLTINDGQKINIRITSAPSFYTIKEATVNIEGISKTFRVTTVNKTGKSYPPNFLESAGGFGVVIGDSIAQGSIERFSRLQPERGSAGHRYDPSHLNEYGQLSFHLEEGTGITWFNHGIAGQSTTKIWERWPRDVLAQNYDPLDGRGGQTLSEPPSYVLINAGINDVLYNVSVDVIKENIGRMVESAKSVGMTVILSTIGYHKGATNEQLEIVLEINDWIRSLEVSEEIVVVDFYSWGYNKEQNRQKGCRFADSVHPNLEGYEDFSRVVMNKLSKLVLL